MTTTLPMYLTQRPATLDDLQAVAELSNLCDLADSGEEDTNVNDILVNWLEEGFDLASASNLLVASDGLIVGYTDIHVNSSYGFTISPYTLGHPGYRGQGLERYLLHVAEQRVYQYLDSFAGGTIPRNIRAYSFGESGNRMLEEEGYQLLKVDWRMQIKLNEQPPAPQWPQGISVRPYIQGQEERMVHEIIQEAFSELRGRTFQPFEEWLPWAIQREDFDPSRLFLVLAGEEPIGTALCFGNSKEGWGWIRQLAIHKPWQGKGIGQQFLRYLFGNFYGRGESKVGLVVDSENPSGATHVYQRVGMHVASQFSLHQKEV